MIRYALVAVLVIVVCVAAGAAQEKLVSSAFVLDFRPTSSCSISIGMNGQVTHNCRSLDEAAELFWSRVSRIGLDRSGQVREALELAAEFVHDPDESFAQTLEYRDSVGRLEQQIARLQRQRLAAQKIREALALLEKN